MKLQYLGIILAFLVILAGCAQSEVPSQPVKKVPAAPLEKAPAAIDVEEEVEAEAGEEKVMEKAPKKMAPVATNKVKLVPHDGYVGFETKDVSITAGSSITFEYAGAEKGKTVVTITNEEGKLLIGEVGKPWSSGYMTIVRNEWTTPVFEEPGVYKMKVTFGKADEGTITVK